MLIKMQKSNDASNVLKATYNKVSFLLMSDADKAIEDEINSKVGCQSNRA
jgi:beta-lactamase superfamily II metal-dependent hydrolase